MKSTNVEMCIEAAAKAEAVEALGRAALEAACAREATARAAFDSTHVESDAEAFTKAVLLAGSTARAHAAAVASLEAARSALSEARGAEAAAADAAEIEKLMSLAAVETYVQAVRADLEAFGDALVTMSKAAANIAAARKRSNDALRLLHGRGKAQNLREIDGVADAGILVRRLNEHNVHFADLRGIRFALASGNDGAPPFPGTMVAVLARYVEALAFKCTAAQLAEERNAVAVYPESRDISEANARAATTSKVKAA